MLLAVEFCVRFLLWTCFCILNLLASGCALFMLYLEFIGVRLCFIHASPWIYWRRVVLFSCFTLNLLASGCTFSAVLLSCFEAFSYNAFNEMTWCLVSRVIRQLFSGMPVAVTYATGLRKVMNVYAYVWVLASMAQGFASVSVSCWFSCVFFISFDDLVSVCVCIIHHGLITSPTLDRQPVATPLVITRRSVVTSRWVLLGPEWLTAVKNR